MKNTLSTLTVLLLAIALVVVLGALRHCEQELEALRRQRTALQDERTRLCTALSAERLSVGQLRMTVGELRELRKADAALIESLGIRLRHTRSFTLAHSITRLDTLVGKRPEVAPSEPPAMADTTALVDYNDKWITLRVREEEGAHRVELTSRDTLRQVVHRIPYRWWIFSWGTKAIRQEIVTSNPHTQLSYAEYIRIEN